MFLDAMSVPQIGAQFGEIHNNGTGGGNGGNWITPYSNGSSSSVPGSSYPLSAVHFSTFSLFFTFVDDAHFH